MLSTKLVFWEHKNGKLGMIPRFANLRLRSLTWYLVALALVLWICPWLWKGIPDEYFPYSGVVVEKGIDSHLAGLGGWGRYIIIQDAPGERTKKYVNLYGYGFVRVGTFVVKKRGLKEYPLPPDELSPSELRREIEKQKLKNEHKIGDSQ
ncbi:MAG TPA: hypothetical protein VG759_09840 [Candidatus Angelobacter sp.]|nr:hypothetical protein [Candidatus Angelobacter sp.]